VGVEDDGRIGGRLHIPCRVGTVARGREAVNSVLGGLDSRQENLRYPPTENTDVVCVKRVVSEVWCAGMGERRTTMMQMVLGQRDSARGF
jgi:hypothetical protein